MNTPKEITNIYSMPTSIKKQLFNPTQTYIVSQIKKHANETCRGKISQEYINKSCNKFKNGYLYTKGNEIVGFVIWKLIKPDPEEELNSEFLPSKYLFIQLICTKPMDLPFVYSILYDVEKYCANNHIPCMLLEPLNTKLEEYYRAFGFRTLSLFPKISMTKPIIELILQPTNYRKTLKRSHNSLLSIQDKKVIKYLIENGQQLEDKLNYERLNTPFN